LLTESWSIATRVMPGSGSGAGKQAILRGEEWRVEHTGLKNCDDQQSRRESGER